MLRTELATGGSDQGGGGGFSPVPDPNPRGAFSWGGGGQFFSGFGGSSDFPASCRAF